MCLIVNTSDYPVQGENTGKITGEDITVYKVGRFSDDPEKSEFRPKYFGFHFAYRRGEPAPCQKLTPRNRELPGGLHRLCWYVNEGYHAYTSPEASFFAEGGIDESMEDFLSDVAVFVIPKGSRYYCNCSGYEIVADNITYLGPYYEWSESHGKEINFPAAKKGKTLFSIFVP